MTTYDDYIWWLYMMTVYDDGDEGCMAKTLSLLRVSTMNEWTGYLLSICLQAINPGVAHAITELLLLAPKHRLGQVGVRGVVKGFAQDVLLHLLVLAIWQVLHVNLHSDTLGNHIAALISTFIMQTSTRKQPCAGYYIQLPDSPRKSSMLINCLLIRQWHWYCVYQDFDIRSAMYCHVLQLKTKYVWMTMTAIART